MAHNTETVRGTGSFRVRDGRILLFRVGPANARRQTHNRCSRDMVTGERKEWDPDRGDYADYLRRTPEPRGFWAFPYPFQDAFFYSHVWRRELPKALRDGAFEWDNATEEECEAHSLARETKLREIKRLLRPKLIWHGGPFYARVRPRGMVGERPWWLYESPRDYVESARGELWTWARDRASVWKCDYGADHLEIFVPG